MAKETQSAAVCYEKEALVLDSRKGRTPRILKLSKYYECIELTLFRRNSKKYIAVSGPILYINNGKREIVRTLGKDEDVAIIWNVLHVKTIEDFETLMVKLLQRYS
jgi:hypothetical protein